jgi:uncharacterized protein
MKLVTSLDYIKEMAFVREKENLYFRALLKQHDLSSDEIDAIVHKMAGRVTSQIDCPKCANCCKQIKPALNKADISRFSVGLRCAASQFQELHLCPDKENSSQYTFKKLPCPFLHNNKCSNYDYRPGDCRSYPHLHKKDFIFRLWSVVENYEICPIVFNIYEQLKTELWHNRIHDSEDFEWW